VRILDLTRLLPGGVCTLLLADMGAQVIKIEDPDGGDYARWMPPLVDGLGAFFRAANRNKQSVILNLKDVRGQAVLKKLAEHADVLIEGNRPGVMARLHCDGDAMRAVNPRLIYCSLSGWGQDGPYARHSGHDLNYLAIAGMLGAMHRPQPLGGQVADTGGALVAVGAILAALFQRERTGEGAYIDASLFESGLLFLFQPWVEAVTLHSRGEPGALTGGLACYNVYTTRDGKPVALAALEPKFWTNFCNSVERPDLIEEYQSPARQAYLLAEVAGLFSLRTAAEWDALLRDADCCYTPVNTLNATADDPHVQARELLNAEGGVPRMRSPFRLDSPASGAAPGYGEHTRAALHNAGYSDAEIEALYAAGVAQG
jgi:crotonobetainyl-CoA:carnitine CoA-transferase CaiB-like acyl-CoA transferase